MAGPNGQRSAMKLTDSLVKAGLTLMRFKTGTPARVDRRTIDFRGPSRSTVMKRCGISPLSALLRNVSRFLVT